MSTTVACKHCGALNGNDFERCIRCNSKLDGAEPADKASRRVPAPRVRGHGKAVGGGSEPLLGRWEAEQLPAAKLMLAMNMAVFAFQLLLIFQRDPSVTSLLFGGGSIVDSLRFGALPLLSGDSRWGLELARVLTQAGLDPVIVRAEPWRLFTACFVHAGVIHIGFNMYWMVQLGRMIEPAIGSIRFLIAYILTGVLGFMATVAWWLVFPSDMFTVGASGSVFGLIGLVLGFLWRRRDPRWKQWMMRAVVYTLIITFLLSAGGPVRINHTAHIGGLVAGAGFGALFGPGAPQPSRPWQRWIAYALVLMSFAALVAVQLSPYVTVLTKAIEAAS